MFKCSKGVTGILTALIVSSLSYFDLGTDSFNGYTYLNGTHYKKTVTNHSDDSVVKDCKWIGGMQRYNMTGNETRNYGTETYNYECYEVDMIWGIITLMVIFLPGLRQVAAFMDSEGAFKKEGCFKKMALYVSMLFTFPIQLLFVKFVEPFGGPEWSKVGSLYSGLEAMWEGALQLMLQLFIIFGRTDRQPSIIQLISLITSFASFMIAHKPKPNLTLKVGSEEIIPSPCKCSSLLGLTFVDIKSSFTKMLLFFNSKNFRIICYWKKQMKVNVSNVLMLYKAYSFYNIL